MSRKKKLVIDWDEAPAWAVKFKAEVETAIAQEIAEEVAEDSLYYSKKRRPEPFPKSRGWGKLSHPHTGALRCNPKKGKGCHLYINPKFNEHLKDFYRNDDSEDESSDSDSSENILKPMLLPNGPVTRNQTAKPKKKNHTCSTDQRCKAFTTLNIKDCPTRWREAHPEIVRWHNKVTDWLKEKSEEWIAMEEKRHEETRKLLKKEKEEKKKR